MLEAKIERTKITMPEKIKISEKLGNVEIIPAINAVGCVDPRSTKAYNKSNDKDIGELNNTSIFKHRVSHEAGALRSPGASMGEVMSLLGTSKNISVEQAVETVIAFEKSEGREFTFHEDTHKHGLGCGHVDKAKENPELYGIQKEQVKGIVDYVNQKIANEETIADVPMLQGDHHEAGVLVVLTDEKDPKTITAVDDKRNEFFRYDKTQHDNRLNRLAKFAQEREIEVTAEDLIKASENQRNATLMLLGAGLPVYEVDLRGKEPTVKELDPVPQRPQKA